MREVIIWAGDIGVMCSGEFRQSLLSLWMLVLLQNKGVALKRTHLGLYHISKNPKLEKKILKQVKRCPEEIYFLRTGNKNLEEWYLFVAGETPAFLFSAQARGMEQILPAEASVAFWNAEHPRKKIRWGEEKPKKKKRKNNAKKNMASSKNPTPYNQPKRRNG